MSEETNTPQPMDFLGENATHEETVPVVRRIQEIMQEKGWVSLDLPADVRNAGGGETPERG